MRAGIETGSREFVRQISAGRAPEGASARAITDALSCLLAPLPIRPVSLRTRKVVALDGPHRPISLGAEFTARTRCRAVQNCAPIITRFLLAAGLFIRSFTALVSGPGGTRPSAGTRAHFLFRPAGGMGTPARITRPGPDELLVPLADPSTPIRPSALTISSSNQRIVSWPWRPEAAVGQRRRSTHGRDQHAPLRDLDEGEVGHRRQHDEQQVPRRQRNESQRTGQR